MSEHIAKAFDADLQDLNRMLAEMGGLAEREIADCVQALTRRDTVLARKLIATDAQVDVLQREIEERAILTIARRQPMAVDLREVVSALRVRRARADRRPCQEYRQARARPEWRVSVAEADPRSAVDTWVLWC